MRRASLTRRDFLAGAAATGLGAGLAGCRTLGWGAPGASFPHGVASGDPLADRVMLWTRVTTAERDPVEVDWRVARDPALRDVVARGTAATGAAADWTVQVDAAGLEPGRTWYYAFRARGAHSPVGRTRTLPAGPVRRLRIASCSCANYPQGFFNAYAAIARRADLDFVVHLGDYIYEYGPEGYGASSIGRDSLPPHEIVSLDDYRARYACYRLDPDLQELHRQHPVIAVWDDHEIANDAWRGGAQNHDAATEGDWGSRRDAAVQAWHEWMPARTPDQAPEHAFDPTPRIWRAFRVGDLADLVVLDTRLVARDAQAPRSDRARIEAPNRFLLGVEQEEFLFRACERSQNDSVAWRLLGQQVVFSPWARPPRPPNPDGWDGYPDARRRVLEHFEREHIDDVVILSGDVHSSWALEVPRARAVEFVAPAISSTPLASFPNAQERFGRSLEELPHLRWFDLERRGYVLLDVDRERAQAEWWFTDTVEERRAGERFAKAFATRRSQGRLEEVAAPSAPRADAPALAPTTP